MLLPRPSRQIEPPTETISDWIVRAEEYEKKAKKKLRSCDLFCFFKYPEAADLFKQAVVFFKIAKSWDRAGSTYAKIANCYLKMDLKSTAAEAYIDAANCCKKTNTIEAIPHLKEAVNLYLEVQDIYMSAKYSMEIAQLYEAEKNFEKAIFYYGRAADLFESQGVIFLDNQCRKRIAKLAPRLE